MCSNCGENQKMKKSVIPAQSVWPEELFGPEKTQFSLLWTSTFLSIILIIERETKCSNIFQTSAECRVVTANLSTEQITGESSSEYVIVPYCNETGVENILQSIKVYELSLPEVLKKTNSVQLIISRYIKGRSKMADHNLR